MMAVYSKNHIKPKNTLHEQNSELLTVKVVGENSKYYDPGVKITFIMILALYSGQAMVNIYKRMLRHTT
jgi:hypothetical protein